MLRRLAALLGIGGVLAIAPSAHASLDPAGEHAAFEQARHGGIEAMEDFLWRFPRSTLRNSAIGELAKFECAQGLQWRCGADGDRNHPNSRSHYGS